MRYIQNQSVSVPAQGDHLPMDRIVPRPSLHFVHEQGTLQALAESIRVNGLCRPVIVQRAGNGRFTIVSGNRRLMACRMLGMSHIPAHILAEDVRWQTANQLISTLITRRMHYLEEADALCALNERHGVSRGELAKLMGMHPQAMTEQMRLTCLDGELRALLMDEGVPMAIALLLLRLPDEKARMSAACRIARERLCVRDAALLVSAALSRQGMPKNKGVSNRENRSDEKKDSQNHSGKVIGVVRDQRLYLNAIRDIAGQMRSAGVDATLRETQCGARLEMTISVSTRRRRSARYQSM